MKVAYVTVGPVAENTFLAMNEQTNEALLIDPGDEPDAIKQAITESGADVKAILITHCHFDHVGAVAAMAEHTGAEVWVPELEREILADINTYMRFPGIGPFESYDAEHDAIADDKLQLAGFDIDVIFTPGHSPGHVTYSIPAEKAIFSGDVLFQGSIGRTDLPGSNTQALLDSLDKLVADLPAETVVFPGHMGVTTLEAEKASNPFLNR